MARYFITGANRGIGLAVVRRWLRDGHNAAVFDLETDNLEPLSRAYPGQLLDFQGDVRDGEALRRAVDAAVAAFGGLDAAVHNACLCPFALEAKTDLEMYRDVFDVNYFGALRLVKAVLPCFLQQNRGKIIFTSSAVGVTGFPGLSACASSKGALESLARCLNLEYADARVTFHLFHPPLTRTASSSPLPVPPAFMAGPEKVGAALARRVDSRRFLICPSAAQKAQVLACYLFPRKMGALPACLTACAGGESAV